MNGLKHWLVMLALLLWCLAVLSVLLQAVHEMSQPRLRDRRLTLAVVLRAPAALLAHYLAPRLSLRQRIAVSERLQRAGRAMQWTAPQWVALCWLTAWLPELWLRRAIRERQRALAEALPLCVEQLVIATGCGQDADAALSLMREWNGDRWPGHLLQRLQHQLQRHPAPHSSAARWRHWHLPPPWLQLIAALERSESSLAVHERAGHLLPATPADAASVAGVSVGARRWPLWLGATAGPLAMAYFALQLAALPAWAIS